MKILDLRDIIIKHGDREGAWMFGVNRYSISGCELLEHVDDVSSFISLLHSFSKFGKMSFVDNHQNPIEFILNSDMRFISDILMSIQIGNTVYYYYEGNDDN